MSINRKINTVVNPDAPSPLEFLPDEIILNIISYLNIADKVSFSKTSQRYRDLIYSLISDPKRVIKYLNSLPFNQALQLVSYYRTTSFYKELVRKYNNDRDRMSDSEVFCYAQMTDDITTIDLQDLERRMHELFDADLRKIIHSHLIQNAIESLSPEQIEHIIEEYHAIKPEAKIGSPDTYLPTHILIYIIMRKAKTKLEIKSVIEECAHWSSTLSSLFIVGLTYGSPTHPALQSVRNIGENIKNSFKEYYRQHPLYTQLSVIRVGILCTKESNACCSVVTIALWNNLLKTRHEINHGFYTNLSRARLVYPDYKSSILTEGSLTGINLEKAYLGGVHFNSSDLTNCNLNGAILNDVKFKNCNLSFINMNQSTLESVKFKNSNLSHGHIRHARINEEVELKNCDLTDVNLSDAQIYGTLNFNQCNLCRTNIIGARYQSIYPTVDQQGKYESVRARSLAVGAYINFNFSDTDPMNQIKMLSEMQIFSKQAFEDTHQLLTEFTNFVPTKADKIRISQGAYNLIATMKNINLDPKIAFVLVDHLLKNHYLFKTNFVKKKYKQMKLFIFSNNIKSAKRMLEDYRDELLKIITNAIDDKASENTEKQEESQQQQHSSSSPKGKR